MKLVSIGIKTTGSDPQICSILEFAAVIFDPDPLIALDGKVNEAGRRPVTFERLLDHTHVQGDPQGLVENAAQIAEIAGVEHTHLTVLSAKQLVNSFRDWIDENSDGDVLTPVGFYDDRFLQRLPGWSIFLSRHRLHRRKLDVGSLYFDPADGEVASLDVCLDKIGCSGLDTRRAIDTALATMTAVTRFFN